jgi:GT2 family glycosyltransferase
MERPVPPVEVQVAADARAEARRVRDWETADRLRAQIEAAGWKVIDEGTSSRLEPAHPPDVVEDGIVRHGASASVPSRLEEPPTGIASVILVATDWPDDLARALDGLRAHAHAGTQVIVVANDPSEAQAAALPAEDESLEVVRTSARLGWAAALNAGIRRAAADTVVLLDTSVEPEGDLVTTLVGALADASVAVTGAPGIVSSDLRHFEAAPAGDVDAIEGYCQAFRRDDYRERGPFDERFRYYRNLDIWWSLVLRDEGEEAPPRRALALDLPIRIHEHRGWTSVTEAERDRLSKRNFYRIIDRFGHRRDLLFRPGPVRAAATRGRAGAGRPTSRA